MINGDEHCSDDYRILQCSSNDRPGICEANPFSHCCQNQSTPVENFVLCFDINRL